MYIDDPHHIQLKRSRKNETEPLWVFQGSAKTISDQQSQCDSRSTKGCRLPCGDLGGGVRARMAGVPDSIIEGDEQHVIAQLPTCGRASGF